MKCVKLSDPNGDGIKHIRRGKIPRKS